MKSLLATVILLANHGLVSPCARTSDSGTVVTTVAPTNCGSCTPAQVQLLPDPDDPVNGHPPSTPVLGTDASGCATLLLSCSPVNNNPESLLTFQGGLGGPAAGNPSTATLTCNANGEFVFGTTVITQAFCLG